MEAMSQQTIANLNPDVFTKISDRAEKIRLFDDLIKSRGELMAKRPDPSADVFLLKAHSLDKDHVLCKVIGATNQLSDNGQLITTFFIGGEKYFLQGDYESKGDQVKLSISSHLYHLQRREDYRVRIPPNFKALFEMVSHNGQTFKLALPLTDLSGGGCRLKVDPKKVKLSIGDELKGHLFLPDRSPIQMTVSVRHSRPEAIEKNMLTVGIQFVGLNDPTRHRLAAVVMDLYREFFIRSS